jgi:hypothetical protein
MTNHMSDEDPVLTSAFVADRGSVGLDAGDHHVWAYGTCSIFAVVGRIHESAAGKRVIDVKSTFDERIEDGLQAAATIEKVKTTLESPESLLSPCDRPVHRGRVSSSRTSRGLLGCLSSGPRFSTVSSRVPPRVADVVALQQLASVTALAELDPNESRTLSHEPRTCGHGDRGPRCLD